MPYKPRYNHQENINSVIKIFLKTALLIIAMQFVLPSQAKTAKTIYINAGMFTAVDGKQFPYVAFNNSKSFDQENARILFNVGDTLQLTVVNKDAVIHGFNIKGEVIQYLISAGDSITLDLTTDEAKAWFYHDHSQNDRYYAMGLGGMIVALNSTSSAKRFYWNIKDHQKSFNDSLSNGKQVEWNKYEPDYFTINGKSHPQINADASARIAGVVGDTIHIYMVNTGKGIHDIHYHGYHCRIIQSTKNPNHIGRSKDTFPIYSKEIVVVELVPHQPGEFPVHEHNLVAVTGGGYYPSGMFSTILIQ
ncbi:MAG: multicopper oxidase domain-containing protein [Bacteroidia bacterium]